MGEVCLILEGKGVVQVWAGRPGPGRVSEWSFLSRSSRIPDSLRCLVSQTGTESTEVAILQKKMAELELKVGADVEAVPFLGCPALCPFLLSIRSYQRPFVCS